MCFVYIDYRVHVGQVEEVQHFKGVIVCPIDSDIHDVYGAVRYMYM